MIVSFVFDLPMPENVANARMHWKTKQRLKLAYYAALDERQNCGLIPAPPKVKFGRCQITSRMFLWAKMDTDNAMARHKWALDWLQTRGYIANDKHLEWTGFPEQIIRRDGESVIVLTLTETTP